MDTPSDVKEGLSAQFLEETLTRTAKEAVQGTLADADRVALYRLALTVAAEEFYRLESNGAGGLVTPEVLILLQQISLLCEEQVDVDKLVGPAEMGYREAVREELQTALGDSDGDADSNSG